MSAVTDSAPSSIRVSQSDARCTAPISTLLSELDAVLAAVSDAQYVQKPVGVIDSSLGGHVRHCLDHIGAVLVGAEVGEIDYDQRERGTVVETDRRAARELITRLIGQLAELEDEAIGRTVRLTAMVTSDGLPVRVGSTIGRELVFVLSHTIHHNALVAAMCRTLGVALPPRFGYAPATIAHLDGAACAR